MDGVRERGEKGKRVEGINGRIDGR